jgi:hypothetical protein
VKTKFALFMVFLGVVSRKKGSEACFNVANAWVPIYSLSIKK